jgi:hypothetical protein
MRARAKSARARGAREKIHQPSNDMYYSRSAARHSNTCTVYLYINLQPDAATLVLSIYLQPYTATLVLSICISVARHSNTCTAYTIQGTKLKCFVIEDGCCTRTA